MADTWQTLPADVSPAPLSCQKEFFLTTFSCVPCRVQHCLWYSSCRQGLQENSGKKCFQATAFLVLLCSLCFAGFVCEHRSMVNLTCDQWQGIPELPEEIYALSHGASQSAVCLLGNLLLRSPGILVILTTLREINLAKSSSFFPVGETDSAQDKLCDSPLCWQSQLPLI